MTTRGNGPYRVVDNSPKWLHGWRWWLVEFGIGAAVFGACVLNNIRL